MCLANPAKARSIGLAAAAGARLSAPHGAVRAARARGGSRGQPAGALRERAPEHPALPRLSEVATLLTGQPDASPEDAIVIGVNHSRAVDPWLASYGLTRPKLTRVVTAAQRASSMRGNPIELE